MEDIPAKQAVVEDLNSKQKQMGLLPDKQKDLRTINTRWPQVGFPGWRETFMLRAEMKQENVFSAAEFMINVTVSEHFQHFKFVIV